MIDTYGLKLMLTKRFDIGTAIKHDSAIRVALRIWFKWQGLASGCKSHVRACVIQKGGQAGRLDGFFLVASRWTNLPYADYPTITSV
jgi:hypothetical protein